MMRKEDQDHESKRADQVAEIDDRPVTQHLRVRNISARPGHHDQVVSREQLGSPNQNDASPSENTSPPNDRTAAKLSSGSLTTMV